MIQTSNVAELAPPDDAPRRASAAERKRAYVAANREKINASNAAYRAANPDRVRAYNERYRRNNAERFRQSQREYKRRRYATDQDYRIICQLKSRLAKALGRGCNVTALVRMCGCSMGQLRAHIESLFQPGMTWGQRRDWHIDHIYPIAAIDTGNATHLAAINNWRNLRPMWAADNHRKSAAITPEAEALFNSIARELQSGGGRDSQD